VTVPLSWGRWPYQKALDSLKRSVKKIDPDGEIWPRNSFLTEAFRPLKSDLDVTLWVPGSPTRLQRERFLETLKRHKMFFPLLGECNAYAAPLAFRWAFVFNPYERLRDPLLDERFTQNGCAKIKTSPAYQSAFLLRQIWTDRKNLKRNPKLRQRKWSLHLASVGKESSSQGFHPEKPFESLLSLCLSELLRTQDPVWIYQRVKEVRACLEGKGPLKKSHLPVSFAALYPHLFHDARAVETDIFPPLQEITLAQLEWELWGLQSQMLLRLDPAPYENHFKQLILFCEKAASTTGTPTFLERAENFKELLDQGSFIP